MIETPEQNIVVIGAGYGGITAALRLSQLFRRHPEHQIRLVDKNPYHTLKTQLHEAAVHRREVSIDIGRIIHRHRIMFHLGEVTKLDMVDKVISLDDSTIPFQALVFALGSQSNFYAIPGLMENAFTLQSVADAERIYHHISALCARASSENDRGRRKEMLRFVVGMVKAAKSEGREEYIHFAEKLKLHAQTEEEVTYPTALLIGEYLKLKFGR